MKDLSASLTDERILSVRIRALELANVHCGGAQAVETARLYADFLLGTGDAEIIDAAREFAKKVG